MLRILTIFCLLIMGFVNVACDGNACSALTDPLDDGDSDCIADTSDNCPGVANYDQIDIDEDGVGAACDTDDSDDTVADVSPSEDSEPSDNF